MAEYKRFGFIEGKGKGVDVDLVLSGLGEGRERLGLPPRCFGAAGSAVVKGPEAEARREVTRMTDVSRGAKGYANYQDWIENTQLEHT